MTCNHQKCDREGCCPLRPQRSIVTFPSSWMRIRIFSTPRGVGQALGRNLARAISARPSLVLGLPTGHTPIPLYRELIALQRAGRLDCAGVTTFNLDEF